MLKMKQNLKYVFEFAFYFTVSLYFFNNFSQLSMCSTIHSTIFISFLGLHSKYFRLSLIARSLKYWKWNNIASIPFAYKFGSNFKVAYYHFNYFYMFDIFPTATIFYQFVQQLSFSLESQLECWNWNIFLYSIHSIFNFFSCRMKNN